MLSSPWVWNHPNMVGWACFTWVVFDQFVLALKTQPTWLRENHWVSMLIIHNTAYLPYCYADCLCYIYDFTCWSRKYRKHLPSNVNLMKMRSYLLMLEIFMITLMLKRLKSLLHLRV